MEQENPRFDYLLNQYLSKKSTPIELEELMAFIRDDVHDVQLKEHILKTLYEAEGRAEMQPFRKDEILRRAILRNQPIYSRKLLKRGWIRLVAASFVLFALGMMGWLFFQPIKNSFSPQIVQEKTDVRAEPSFIRLPDGSTVLLTAGSKLVYPPTFTDKQRRVKLIGEGYFDISDDPSKPFVIESGTVLTKVLGTAFNIRAYPDETAVVVTVDHGSVQVNKEAGEPIVLKRNEQVAIDTKLDKIEKKTVDVDALLAWQKSVIVLDDIDLKEAAAILERKYNIRITFANERIKNCHIKVSFFEGEDLEQVLHIISGVLNLTWEITDNHTILLEGSGC